MKSIHLLLASVVLAGCAKNASIKPIPPHGESGWNYESDKHGNITPQEERSVETGVSVEFK